MSTHVLFHQKNPHSSLIFLFVFTPSSNYSINCTITRYTCIELTRIKGTFQSPCLQDIQWNRRSFIIRNTWLCVCDDIIISFVLAFLRWFYVLLALACPSLFLYSLLIISRKLHCNPMKRLCKNFNVSHKMKTRNTTPSE